jgi:Sec-independent protein translocase protein TatA
MKQTMSPKYLSRGKLVLSILLFTYVCLIGFAQSSESEELGHVIFAPDSTNFENGIEAKSLLDKYAQKITETSSKEKQVHIMGYTAIFKNDVDPLQLSTDRANTVFNELKARGISSERIDLPKGNGETDNWGDNIVSENRKPNRRVTVSIDIVNDVPPNGGSKGGGEIKIVDPTNNGKQPKEKAGFSITNIFKAIGDFFLKIFKGIGRFLKNVWNFILGLFKPKKEKDSEGGGFRFPWWILIVILIIVMIVFGIKNIGSGPSSKGRIRSAKRSENIKTSKKHVTLDSDTSQTRMPATGGEWTGDRGNSEFKPDLDKKPQRFNDSDPNKQLTWREIIKGNKDFVNRDTIIPNETKTQLNNEYDHILNGEKGIPFKEGEVDFSPLAIVTVTISNFSTERYGSEGNMSSANIEAAKQLNMMPDEFNKWKNHNELMWHECKDRKTMILISHDIHDNIDHSGGISEQKRLESNR